MRRTLEKKHTINDIARLANVSKKTVSRVINESPFVREETRTPIDEIIRSTGFTPDPQARGLAFRRSFLIGLVYDNPNAQYVINMQEGALDALRRVGYELVVHPCDRNSPEFLSDIRQLVSRQKLDGMLLLPPVSENPAARGAAAGPALSLRPHPVRGAWMIQATWCSPWTANPPPKWPSIWRSSGTRASR